MNWEIYAQVSSMSTSQWRKNEKAATVKDRHWEVEKRGKGKKRAEEQELSLQSPIPTRSIRVPASTRKSMWRVVGSDIRMEKRRAFQKKKLFKLHKMLFVQWLQMPGTSAQDVAAAPENSVVTLGGKKCNWCESSTHCRKTHKDCSLTQKMPQVLVENYSSFVLIW